MTSHPRSQRDPIKSIELRITLHADGRSLRELALESKGVRVRGDRALVVIRSTEPKRVIEEAREVIEAVRNFPKSPKDFKHSRLKSRHLE